MAPKNAIKRVGAVVLSGAAALLPSSITLRREYEAGPLPQYDTPLTTAPLHSALPTSRKGTTGKTHILTGILRRAAAFPRGFKGLFKHSNHPKDSKNRNSPAGSIQSALAIAMFNAVKLRKASPTETENSTSSPMMEESSTLSTESTNEVIVEGASTPTPAASIERSMVRRAPSIDTIVSGFADDFSSEVLSIFDVDTEQVSNAAPSTLPSALIPGNFPGHHQQASSIKEVQAASPLATKSFNHATPAPTRVCRQESTTSAYVNCATQTEEVGDVSISKAGAPSKDLYVQVDLECNSSPEPSPLESQRSASPETPDTIHSDSPTKLDLEQENEKLKAENSRLVGVIHNLNERIEDLETSEEVSERDSKQEMQQLRAERDGMARRAEELWDQHEQLLGRNQELRYQRGEFEHDAEHLRGQLKAVEAQHEQNIAANVAAYERARKVTLKELQDKHQDDYMQGVAKYKELQNQALQQQHIIKTQKDLIDCLEQENVPAAVAGAANALREAEVKNGMLEQQLAQQAGHIYNVETLLARATHQVSLLPQIQDEVAKLISERNALQHQLNALRRQQPAPVVAGIGSNNATPKNAGFGAIGGERRAAGANKTSSKPTNNGFGGNNNGGGIPRNYGFQNLNGQANSGLFSGFNN
ncbi:hypothetical protein LTR84_001025 [Exophiala bonariae]|uniref:Uncharacterized protein n=1 Tax=Exophiala bonariae TaxID=1690606 RepID=A0AAV9NSM6_9EURO|nr:hypothetical protein LTR84_001025 [Exophiala bonariae]